MTTDQIKKVQETIGAVPDGFWGPKSIAECKVYLQKFWPNPHPWPTQGEEALTRFFGEPGDESQLVRVPAPVPWFMDGQKVSSLYCHKKVAPALVRAILASYRLHPEVIEKYDGCYNNRVMRGGSRPSLHARGAAIDFDAEHNGNSTSWPHGSSMPLAVMVEFCKEGFLPAGAFWGRDAMHFQATRSV